MPAQFYVAEKYVFQIIYVGEWLEAGRMGVLTEKEKFISACQVLVAASRIFIAARGVFSCSTSSLVVACGFSGCSTQA